MSKIDFQDRPFLSTEKPFIGFDKKGFFHFAFRVPEDEDWMDIYYNTEAREFIESLRLCGDPYKYIQGIRACLYDNEYKLRTVEKYHDEDLYHDMDFFYNCAKDMRTILLNSDSYAIKPSREEKKYLMKIFLFSDELKRQVEEMMTSVGEKKPYAFKIGKYQSRVHKYFD